MIPIIYESNEMEFSSNGLARLPDCISADVVEERNGVYEVNFEYPVNGHNFDLIKLGRIIAVKHDRTEDVQPFDIVSCSKPINGVVSFHAVHISYRQSKIVAYGTNINSLAAAFALLKNGTPENPFSYVFDRDRTGYFAAADGVPRTVRSMLGGSEGSILDSYGGEYKFDKFLVSLMQARGQVRDITIRYGVNLIDYQEDVDYSETYAACIPFWIGQDANGAEKTVRGGLVSLPDVSSYTKRVDAVPLDLTDKFETIPTAAQLESTALSLMRSKNVNLPSQSIKVNFVNLLDSGDYDQYKSLSQCELCDTINVDFPLYNAIGKFKIVKTVYDVLTERYTEFELGTLSTSLASALGVSGGGTLPSGASGGGGSLPGIIQMFGGSSAPDGWLLCDGSAVSRSTYSKLFEVIGTTYGAGDGSTTFNLPDLRNRFPVGAGDTYSLNTKGGANTVKLNDAQMAHGHGFTQPSVSGGGHEHDITFYYRNSVSYQSGNAARPYSKSGSLSTENWAETSSNGAHSHTVSGGAVANLSGASSTRTAHENRPPYIGLNFIICTG